MKQYPHFLYKITTTETVRDSKGNYIPSTSAEEEVSICREETNGKGSKISAGGEFIIFSSIIYLPLSCESIKEGTIVNIYDAGDIPVLRISGKVLKFDKGQLNNRLWI